MKEVKRATEASTYKKGWEVPNSKVDCCGLIDEKKEALITITPKAQDKILAMLNHVKEFEWVAYLIGQSYPESDCYNIDDIVIPEQEVTSGSVEITDKAPLPEGIIGTVHSHHSMGAFLSQTDHDYFAGNHPVTLVVSNSGWAQEVTKPLPCGKLVEMKAKLMVEYPRTKGLEKFITDNSDKISKITYETPATNFPRSQYQPKCACCEAPKPWTELSWCSVSGVGGRMFCEMCKSSFDGMTDEEKRMLLKAIDDESSVGAGQKTVRPTERGRRPRPNDLVMCDGCQVYLPAKQLTKVGNANFCKECYTDNTVYGGMSGFY